MTNEEKIQSRIAEIENAIIDLCHYSTQLGGDSWLWDQLGNIATRLKECRSENKFEE